MIVIRIRMGHPFPRRRGQHQRHAFRSHPPRIAVLIVTLQPPMTLRDALGVWAAGAFRGARLAVRADTTWTDIAGAGVRSTAASMPTSFETVKTAATAQTSKSPIGNPHSRKRSMVSSILAFAAEPKDRAAAIDGFRRAPTWRERTACPRKPLRGAGLALRGVSSLQR